MAPCRLSERCGKLLKSCLPLLYLHEAVNVGADFTQCRHYLRVLLLQLRGVVRTVTRSEILNKVILKVRSAHKEVMNGNGVCTVAGYVNCRITGFRIQTGSDDSIG